MSVLQSHEQERDDNDLYARLTVPTHQLISSFRKHEKVEGFLEDRDTEDFMGCDRLLKIDHLYGTIQLGYDPKKGQSFLFAHIKTSILDNAASSYQRQLKAHRMKRNQKDDNENTMFTAKQDDDTAVILFNKERKPWTEDSIGPYLMRINQGALRKTMPFLDKTKEREDMEKLRREAKDLGESVRQAMSEKRYEDLDEIRMGQMTVLRQQEITNSLLIRKQQQTRLFFRKVNYAFDMEKQDMFNYYRGLRAKAAKGEKASNEEPAKPPTDNDKDKDEENE